LLHAGELTPIVDVDNKLGKIYKFVAGASLIPRAWIKMFHAFVEWAVKHNALVNGRNANPALVDKYARISWNSSVVTDAERIHIANEMGITSDIE
jgi:hypothetical protein